MDYSGYSDVSLSFRTWELLYDKEVSRAVDEVITEKPHANDGVKRLIRSFLPRFPDECRLSNEMEILDANWYEREQEEDNEETTHRLGINSCPGTKGDSIWVLYHKNGGFVYDILCDDSSGSETGIARVILLSDPVAGAKVPVKLRDVISFERFFEYFEYECYIDQLDAVQFDAYLNAGGSSSVRMWRSHSNGVFGIDSFAAQGDYYGIERVYKQLDGSWVYAYSVSNWYYEKNLPKVGLCFMPEGCVDWIIESFANYDNYVEER